MPSTAVRTASSSLRRRSRSARPCSASRCRRSPSSRTWSTLAPPVCSRRSRRPSTWARISSSALRASDSPDTSPAPACSSSARRAVASAACVLARPASARASARSAAVCSSACSTSPERFAGSASISATPPSCSGGGSSLGSGGGGAPTARKATIVPALGPSSSSSARPSMAEWIHSTTVWWLSRSWAIRLPRGAAISRASRKPLNSRLWLMLTGTSVSATSSSCPSLRRTVVSTWPPDSGSSASRRSVSGSGRPSMRCAGQPNSCSAGRLQRVTAPSRSVSTKRASTSWRSSSSTTSAVEACEMAESSYIRPFSVGPGGSEHDRPATGFGHASRGVKGQSRPCSSAPLTAASTALRRAKASASGVRKRRPGSESAP